MPAKLAGPDDLALALKLLRRIKDWQRQDLASACGLSARTIEAYEQGIRVPPPATVGSMLAALGVSLPTLSDLMAIIRTVRQESRPDDSDGAASAARFEPRGVSDAAPQIVAMLIHQAGPDRRPHGPATLGASRQEAPALWARFQGCSEAGQRDLVREAAEFQSSGFCELLCEESRKAASDSAKRARYLAELAVMAAERTAGDEPWHCRLRGYAGVHLANSQRVGGGELPAATQTFGAAEELWTAGAAADPDLLNAARVLHLKASLRRAQRRVPEALALLDEALAADRWGERPSLLISKAKAVEELGDYEAAIGWLRQAARLIDGERDPLSWFNVLVSLSGNLCHLRQFAEAKQLLREVQALAQKLGNQLDLLRVSWQRGKIAAGLGRTGEAIAIFERVRSAFAKQGNAYDAALVTLELAEVYAFMGRTAEVKAMARKSAPIFEAQGVHREARRALALCRRAAEHERLSAKLLRGVIAYLYRARHDPHLRFDSPR
jgi:tetratricopeptide (TPR) repeat protein/transcriptional regulator with XRE-family HTH domain